MARKQKRKQLLTGIPKLVVIKKFTPTTIKQISLLLRNCWEHPVHIPRGKWFLVKKGKTILAAGQLDEYNTLWNLCTSKKYRGQGYARKIIHGMLNKICREKGVMSLFVDSSSPKSWYERLGFETTTMNESERLKYAHRPDVEKMSRYACNYTRRSAFSFSSSHPNNSNAPSPGGPKSSVSFRMKREDLKKLHEKRYQARGKVLGDPNLVNLLSKLTGESAVSTAAAKAGKEARQQEKKKAILRDQGMRLMQNALDSIFSTDDQISDTAFKQFKSYVDPPSSENPGNYDLLSSEVVVKSVSDKKDIPKGSAWVIPEGYKKLTDYYTTHTDEDGDEYYNITKSDHSTYSKPELFTANISPKLRRERLFVYVSDLMQNVSAYPVKIDSPIIKLVEELIGEPDPERVSQPVNWFLTYYLDNALDGASRTAYVSEGIEKFNERLDKIKVCLGKIVVDPEKSLSFSVDDSISVDGMRDPEGYDELGKYRQNREPPIEFVIRIPSDFMFQYLIDRGADLGYKDQYGQDILFMVVNWGTTGQLKLLYEHYKKKFGSSKTEEFLRGQIDDAGKRYPDYDAHCKPSNPNQLTFGPSLTEKLFRKRGSDSPLLIASFKCRLDMVKELVKLALPSTSSQAQRYNFMNQRNSHLVTPLLASMYQNICGRRLEADSNYDLLPAKQVELFKFLVENGADPNLGEQISGKAGDYESKVRRKLGPSTGAREYNKNTPLMIALFEQRFGTFDMSVEWARLLVDQGASVLQLDNEKRIVTFSTKEARAKNLEWKLIQEQKEEDDSDEEDGITWSLPEMEILAITVDSDLANTTDYIPIVCKSNTLCRPVTSEEIEYEIDESLTIDGNTRQNVALGLYINWRNRRLWGHGSFGGSSGKGILDEENRGRYPTRNFEDRKECEEDIRENGEDDIINWLIDKAGEMGDPRINSLLESIKAQIADIGSKNGILQSKWRQSILRVPKIDWGREGGLQFRMRGKKKSRKSGRKPKKVGRKRRATKPKSKRKKVHKNQLIVDNILAQTCKKVPEGVTHCLVQTRKGTHYVPIVKNKGNCKLDIKDHPGIDMTNRCGKNITEDLNFHSSKARKRWSKACKYNSGGYLIDSDSACLNRKESSCTVMFRMRKSRKSQRKRSMKRKKSLKKSRLRKPGKNRRKRISLKDLSVSPIRDVEAGKVPISVGRGHNVTISGLINCIGVIITQYSPQTGAPVSVIAGHFETPTMYSEKKHKLTKHGEEFANHIRNLITRIDPNLETSVQFVYGDAAPGRIASASVRDKKIPPNTQQAFVLLKDAIGIEEGKLEPVTGRKKSSITIRVPN